MSFYKLIFIIFAMAFGLVVLTLGYQGVKSSLELRSRAAQQTIEYKRWDFKETAEGWEVQEEGKISVEDGILKVGIISETASITNSSVDTKMPEGNKYIAIRMAVGQGDLRVQTEPKKEPNYGTFPVITTGADNPDKSPSDSGDKRIRFTEEDSSTITSPITKKELTQGWYWGTCNQKKSGTPSDWVCSEAGRSSCWHKPNISCSPSYPITPKPSKPPTLNKFVFTVNYNIGIGDDSSAMYTPDSGKTKPSRELTVGGIADGKMRDYKVHLAGNIPESTVNDIMITFDRGVVPGDQIRVDFIKLTGAVVRPTPASCYCPGTKMACPKGDIGLCPEIKVTPVPTSSERCTNDKDCPAGYICSATPPGGCPVRIVNGIEEHVACARPPTCWLIEPTSTSASCWCPGIKMACPGGDIGLCPETKPTVGVFCPEEVKKCPNGTYVGRIGPSCAFAPCPVFKSTPTPVVGCTEEIMRCPNGTYVGRTGPNCAFAPCPTFKPTPTTATIACPEDVKKCPNGTYVGRIGPNCAFAPCPVQPPTTGVRALICSFGFFRSSSWCGR